MAGVSPPLLPVGHDVRFSVGSMVGGCSSIVVLGVMAAVGFAAVEYLVYAVIVAMLIIFRHQDNIRNLRAGTEHKIGQKGEKR